MEKNLAVTIIIALVIIAILFAIFGPFESGLLKGAKQILVNLPTLIR